MPRYDGTGPMGQGEMTGLGCGPCADSKPVDRSSDLEMKYGRGFEQTGRGYGRGKRRFSQGFFGGRRCGRSF